LKTIDNVINNLMNAAMLSPLGAKGIYLANEKGLVDCRSINTTVNNNGSRIPHERSIAAIQLLQSCYNELEHLESLFFLYYYGYCNEMLEQLIDGVCILAKVDRDVAAHSIKSYCIGNQRLAELAKLLGMTYKQADYKCGKARGICAMLHQSIHSSIEHILIKEKLIE